MKRCRSISHPLVLGLFCLTVSGCNGWQATPPPEARISNASLEVTEQVDLTPPQTPELDSPSPSDIVAPPQEAPTRSSVPSLRPYYEWSDAETAADSLGRMGPAVVPNLLEALQDSNPTVRSLSCRVLARIGPDAVIAVPDLIRLLDDENDRVKREATRALGQIGPAAAESIPELVRLLKEAESVNSDDIDVTVELDESTSQ